MFQYSNDHVCITAYTCCLIGLGSISWILTIAFTLQAKAEWMEKLLAKYVNRMG